MVESRPKLETDNSGGKTTEPSAERLNMVDLSKPTERTNGIQLTPLNSDRSTDRGVNREDRDIDRRFNREDRSTDRDVNRNDRGDDRPGEDQHPNSDRALSNESQDLMRARKAPSMPTPSGGRDIDSVDIPPLPKYDAAEKPQYKPGSVDRTKPLEYLPNLKPFDDAKRTVLLLDDFRNVEMYLRGDGGFSHGELSSRLAEENGFNAIRTQVGFNKPGYFDIGNSLKSINEDIDSGKLKLGNGDIINVSLALNKKFDEVSKVLGMEITPENLEELRPEILKSMREKADDKSIPKETRGWLKQCADINDEVQKLQERGIIVATAEGNKGSDNFNISLLAADKHYSSLNADGTVANYAAHNSLTTEARAEINFYARPLDVFDPKPFSEQTGTYKLEGSSIKIPADEFGGFLDAAAPNSGLAHSIMFAPAEVTVTKDGTIVVTNPTEVPIQPLESPETRLTGYLAFSERGSSFANAFGIPAEFSTESERDKPRE